MIIDGSDNTNAARVYINKDNYFNVIGVRNENLDSVFESIPLTTFNLVVSHYPDNFEKINKTKSDYVLASHSMGGQIYIPIINLFYRPEGAKTYYHGKYLEDGLTLDITNGIGMTKRKARFLADSEIVIYRLTTGS